MNKNPKKIIEDIIFGSRWTLIPFYFILLMALIVYTWFDIKEFFEYIAHLGIISRETALITFIELIDITMIANLGVLIITGSYTCFVNRTHQREGEKISSGMLKVKMASSLVGVTAIQLLAKSLETESITWDSLHKLVFVHVTFLVSVLVLSVVDYLHEKSEKHEVSNSKNLHG